MKDGLVTRRVVAGAAWTVPVILVGQPAAAAACSPTDVVEFTPVLGIVSTTATKPVNGHTLGTFTWTIRNDGSTTILAGTTYTATFTADKAPGSGAKSVLLTPEVTSSFNVPSTTRTLNPDGPPKGEVSVTMTLVLNVNLVPGESVTQKWDVDSETGVGATQLRMTVDVVTYGGAAGCGITGDGGQGTATAIWGAGG